MKYKKSAAEAIKKLTAEQKAAYLTGRDFWSTQDYSFAGLPSVRFSDGPNGLRVQAERSDNFGFKNSLPSTCFPCSCAIACGWDRSLALNLGRRLGEEAAFFGVDVLLGPGVNIKRNPLCGRNFEYFSEDPYLAGALAAEYIKGVQESGVSACVKHFAANNREFARTVEDSVVSDRALNEIYLMPFEMAVKEGGVRAVMTAYNKLNGTYCSENESLISGTLRGQWGFEGIVTSDWVGTSDRIAGIKAGEDLEMPRCALSAEEIFSAVKEGRLKEEDIDACAERLAGFALSERAQRLPYDANEHLEFARKAAAECAVLLKNEGILPLKKGCGVAVIGALAKEPHIQGSGSARVNCSGADDLMSSLAEKFRIEGFERGYRRDGKRDKAAARRALKLAERAEHVIFFAGLTEKEDAEGADRESLFLPLCQTELLKELYSHGIKPVVVLFAGGVVDFSWDDCASAVLHMHLSGAATGGAVAMLLGGECNPCGKLAESYPLSYKEVPFGDEYASDPFKCKYKEDIYVGYRYYDALRKQVKYPFGFGLSYTTFEYSHLNAESGGVRFSLKNTGSCGGAEIIELYISPPDSGFAFAERALKAFEKVFLKAGESREIFIPFDDYAFRTYDEKCSRWRIFAGEYGVEIGSSSRDIRLKTKIFIDGEPAENVGRGREERDKILSAGENGGNVERLFSKKRETITMHSPFIALKSAKGLAGRLIYAFADFYCKSKKQTALLTFRYITMRSVAQYAGFNLARAHGFIDICNGSFFKGLKKMITGKEG